MIYRTSVRSRISVVVFVLYEQVVLPVELPDAIAAGVVCVSEIVGVRARANLANQMRLPWPSAARQCGRASGKPIPAPSAWARHPPASKRGEIFTGQASCTFTL